MFPLGVRERVVEINACPQHFPLSLYFTSTLLPQTFRRTTHWTRSRSSSSSSSYSPRLVRAITAKRHFHHAVWTSRNASKLSFHALLPLLLVPWPQFQHLPTLVHLLLYAYIPHFYFSLLPTYKSNTTTKSITNLVESQNTQELSLVFAF